MKVANLGQINVHISKPVNEFSNFKELYEAGALDPVLESRMSSLINNIENAFPAEFKQIYCNFLDSNNYLLQFTYNSILFLVNINFHFISKETDRIGFISYTYNLFSYTDIYEGVLDIKDELTDLIVSELKRQSICENFI